MSETLLFWLNVETKLSQPIKNIEKDFSNGYYFAEILNKYSILPSLSNFKKDSKEMYDIKNNFRLLKPVFEKMNIYLDEENQQLIINESLGVAAKLIYKIKTQISRRSINFDSLMSKTSLNKKINNMTISTLKTTYNTAPTDGENKKLANTISFRGKIKLEPIRSNNLIYFKGPQKKKRMISNLNEIIEEQTFERSSGNPNSTLNMNSYLGTEKKSTITQSNYNPTVPPLSYSDSLDYCNYISLDNNLNRMGMNVKNIDSKLKKYGVGENNNYIPTDIVIDKITNIVNAEKIRIAEEKESRKLPTEQEKILKQSIIAKHLPINSEEESKGFTSTVKLSNKSKQFKQMKYENYRKTNYSLQPKKRNFNSIYSSETFQSNNMHNKLFTFSKPINTFEETFNPHLFFTSLNRESLPDRIKLINKRNKIREYNIPNITDIIDLIIDLTEECFSYQTEQNDDLLNLPGWRDWMQLFVDGKSCRKEPKKKKAYLDGGMSPRKIRKESEAEEIKRILSSDYCNGEYFDYINFRGNWNINIVPNKSFGAQLKVFDVLGSDIATLLSSGKLILQGVKQSSLHQMSNEAFEMKNEEKENIVIPKTIVYNQLLGEILEINFDNSYKDNQNPLFSSNQQNFTYDHIPIKLCLIGHSFSGRKTQGKILTDTYPNLKVYSIEEIKKKYTDILEKIHTPIEAHPKFKSLKKAQIEQIQKEKDELSESIKDVRDIFEPLFNKEIEDISDENKISLLIKQIQHDFPFKDEKTITEEINIRHQRKTEIELGLDKIHEEQAKKPKTKIKEEQNLKNELEKLINESYSGFILVDFPNTYQQFTLFEKIATGFIQEIDKPINQRYKKIFDLTYGIDKHYHILDNTSDTFKHKKNEGFFDNYIWLEVNEEETLRRVNNRKIDPNTGIVYHMEDNPPPENDKKLNERLIEVTEPSVEKIKNELQEFDEKFPEILDFLSLFKRTCKIDKKDKQEICANIVNLMNLSIKKFDDLENKDFIADLKDNANNYVDIDENENTKYLKRLTESKKKVSYSLSEQIIAEWSSFNQKYNLKIKQIINFFKEQKEKILTQMELIQNEFIDFLNSTSKKKELLNIFITKHNSFMKEFGFLKRNEIVKDEFFRDLSELTGHYWELINMKKDAAINELQLIIKSGFIEKQVSLFYNHLESLFLIETEKFEISMNIIHTFYYSFEPNKNQEANPFIFEVNPSRILKDTNDLNIVDDNKQSSPKIEKIFANSFKLLFEYDLKISEIEGKMKIAASIANLNLSGISSMSHRKRKTLPNSKELKVEQSIFSEVKDIISYEDELKAAVTNEKNKYKLRVLYLKHFGIRYIKELFSISRKTFENLDDWIIKNVKMQNDVMNEIVVNFKEQLDNQELRLDYYQELDVFDIYDILKLKFEDFEVKKDADIPIENKLIDINELNKCYQDLKSFEIQNNYITKERVIDILIKKNLIHKKSKGFSNSFRLLPFYNLNMFIEKLVAITDKGRKLIKIKHLFILLSVLHFKIMDDEDERETSLPLEGKFHFHCYLLKEDFMNSTLWFESTTDKDYCKLIKEFIFNVMKNDDNQINFTELLNVLRLKTINSPKKESESILKDNETYFDVLIN